MELPTAAIGTFRITRRGARILMGKVESETQRKDPSISDELQAAPG